jgi:predicted LPLAT superfamily acyltransferase
LIQEAGNNVIGVLEQTGTAQAQQIQMVGDQGVAMIDQHAGQAQQQIQALGDQSASVIQQQGQAAQSGIQAATAEFNAAASHLAAILSRPQQVNVTVGLNSNMLNAYVDRRNQLEDRRYGAVTEGGF